MALSDNTGHQYEINITAADIAKAILQKLPAATIIETQHEKAQLDVTTEAKDYLKTIDKTIQKELKDVSDNVSEIVKILEDCCGKMSKRPSDNNRAPKQSRSPDITMGLLVEEQKKTNKHLSNLAGGGGGGGGGGSSADSMMAPGNGGWKSRIGKFGKNAGGVFVASFFKEVTSTMEHFDLTGRKIFSGVLVDSIEFNKQMRELTYSVNGTGVAMTNLEKQWLEIGRTTEQTGMGRKHTQEAYIKQLKKGLTVETRGGVQRQRSAKDTLKVVTTSLRTANILGSNAEETADMFGEWNRQLGLSNSQMGSLGRSMEMIARTTGVTGDNLLEAAKASQQTIMAVRNFSGINERAMAQIIEMQASMKKFGSENIGNEINAALAGGLETIIASRPALAAMMNQAAADAGMALGNGILSNPKRYQEFSQSLDERLTKTIQRAAGMPGEEVGKIADTIERLQAGTIQEQRRAEVMLANIKVASGMGIGEAMALKKSIAEGAKTFEQKAADIDKKIRAAPVGSDLHNQLMVQKRDLRMVKNAGDLTDFARKMEYAEGANVAEKTQDVLNQLGLKGQNVGGILNTQITDLRSRAKGAGVNFDESLAVSGESVQSIEKAFAGGDAAKMAEAMSALQEVENKVLTQEKARQDPVLKAQYEVANANDMLKDSMEKLSGRFLSLHAIIGALIAVLTAKTIGSTVATGGGILRDLWRAGGGGMPGGGRPVGGPLGGPRTGGVRTANRKGIPLGNIQERIDSVNARRLAKGKSAFKGKGKFGRLFGMGSAILGTTSMAASATGVGGNPMSGMPGYGSDCVPVCIVGGMGGLGKTITGFMGGALMTKALDATDLSLGAADVAGDVKTVAGAIKGARGAKAATDVARGADVAGDVAKASGIMSKIPGMSKAAGVASKIPGVARFLPALRVAGNAGGKVLPFLGPIIGAATGALESATGDSQGRGMIESTILGALTGDSKTGSMFSGMLGIEQGSTADELMGVAGSTLGGAATGAALGTVLIPIPGVGTAIGAAVGAALGGGAEVYKILTNPDSPIRKWAGETMDALGSGINTVAGMMGIDLMKVSNDTGFTDTAIAAAKIWEGDFLGAGKSMVTAYSKYASFVTFGLSDTVMDWGSKLVGTAGSWLSSMGTTLSGWWDSASSVISGTVSGAASLANEVVKTEISIASGVWDFAKSASSTIISAQSAVAQGAMSALGLGAFAGDQGKEAGIVGTEGVVGSTGITALSAVMPGGMLASLASAGLFGAGAAKLMSKLYGNKDKEASVSPMDAGLFAKDNIYDTDIMARDAMSKTVGGITDSDLQRVYDRKKLGEANSTRALYLSEDAEYGDTLNNSLVTQYGKDTKGQMSATSMSDEDMEYFVSQNYESGKASASKIDAVFNPNDDQLDKLDQVIALLSQIRDKTGFALTMSVPEMGSGVPSTERSGVRAFSKSRNVGKWPLQSGAFQPTQNYTGD